MKRLFIDSVEDLNVLLADMPHAVNGKNFQVTELYPTSANSRWPLENIWGVYLAKPAYAWMALWMAITSRRNLRKRQIGYIRPDVKNGDRIGRAIISNPAGLPLDKVLSPTGYLYLFRPEPLLGLPTLSFAWVAGEFQDLSLRMAGFSQQTIERRGRSYRAYVYGAPVGETILVDVGEWQIAVAGEQTLVPDIEVTIDPVLIRQLGQRILWTDDEIGSDYILPFAPHA